MEKSFEMYGEIIRNCDALLIGAGAGMSVDSGLPDFRGNEGFWRAYPPLAKLGIRFEEMANPRWFRDDPELAWGFYGHRYNLYQKVKPHPGYFILRDWIAHLKLPHFVYTSNVDGHFIKAGWVNQILECHGSLMHLQCMNSCGQGTWSMTESVHKKFEVCPKSLICKTPLPVCPKCGNIARPNILMFSDFDWDTSRNLRQHKRLSQWLIKHGGKNLLIMEFGAGLNVPTVRSFCEKTWLSFNCQMLRINPRDSQVANGIHSIRKGALDTLQGLDKYI